MMNVSKKKYLLIVLIYTAFVLLSKYVFHWALGNFLITLGWAAVLVLVLFIVFQMLRQFIGSRKN